MRIKDIAPGINHFKKNFLSIDFLLFFWFWINVLFKVFKNILKTNNDIISNNTTINVRVKMKALEILHISENEIEMTINNNDIKDDQMIRRIVNNIELSIVELYLL